MKSKLFFDFVFSMFFQFSFAQLGYGKLDDIKAIQKTPLLVVLQSQNEKKLKKLTKKRGQEAAQDYINSINLTNKALKDALPNNWSYTNDITFVTKEELEKYDTKKNKGKYAILNYGINSGDLGNISLIKNKGLITTYDYGVYLSGKKRAVYEILTQGKYLSEGDVIFTIQHIQNYLNDRLTLKSGKMSCKEMKENLNKNAALIKDKTLLVSKNNLKSDFVNQIEKMYPYQLRFATQEEIDEAIINKPSDLCYLRIIPAGQQSSSSGSIKTYLRTICVRYRRW